MKQIVSMAAVLVAMALASTASAQVQTGSILVRATDEQVWSVRTLTGVSSFRVGGDPAGAINAVPQFGTPTDILGPRIARLGVTFRF